MAGVTPLARRPLPRRVLALCLLLGGPAAVPAGDASGERPSPSDAVRYERWTGSWLACPDAPQRDPGVFRFRKVLDLSDAPSRFVVHASGDQRFVLFVNGQRAGIGPSRGDLDFWRFESFDLARFLKAGPNLLVALVWNFGTLAPAAQVTDRTGFVLQGDTEAERAADTDATWECEPEPGHQPWPEGMRALRDQAHQYVVVGPGERLDASLYDWGWARMPAPGTPSGRWKPAVAYDRPSPRAIRVGPGYGLSPEGRLLVPDPLPPMEYREVEAGELVRRSGTIVPPGFPRVPVTVPARSRATLLLDRRELVAAYPELAFSSGRGSRVRLTYQEALVSDGFRKGNRDDIEGKRMLGYSDEVLPDGGRGRVFQPLWWRTWRYLQIDVETQDESLVLEGLRAHATGYPFEERARLETDDASLGPLWEVGWRTARLCAHETYVDCPYYEQLQYAGDTRIQALISYTVAGDDRLARQAIAAFQHSRRSEGLTSSRYPSSVPQYIPPFSLLWVGMVHDFWMYRDDPAFVREQLPGTRDVLDWFLDRQEPGGLVSRLPWWNFLDWALGFTDGVAPVDREGRSAPLTLQLVNALREAAELEEALGEGHRAAVYREQARAAAEAVRRECWDEERGLVADRPGRDRFSQQTNILALLADAVPPERRQAVLDEVLASGAPSVREGRRRREPAPPPEPLVRASYYFRFYLARALDQLGRGDAYLAQLEPWREMLDLGLTTWAEAPFDDTRSDCHAWSAHPSYDLLTIVAGLRPGSPGFRTVRVEPHLGSLGRLEARMPHPRGEISVAYRRDGSALEATVVLPPGLRGEFVWRGFARGLGPGEQSFRVQ